jgi:hypothetical protein
MSFAKKITITRPKSPDFSGISMLKFWIFENQS